MLDHVGEAAASARLMDAIERALACDVPTPDLGGRGTTAEVTQRVVELLEAATAERDALSW